MPDVTAEISETEVIASIEEHSVEVQVENTELTAQVEEVVVEAQFEPEQTIEVRIGEALAVGFYDTRYCTKLYVDTALESYLKIVTFEDWKNIQLSVVTTAVDYTLTASNTTLQLDGSENTVTASLPTAVGIAGKVYTVNCIDDTFQCDILPFEDETLDGYNENFLIYKGDSASLKSDGVGWIIF